MGSVIFLHQGSFEKSGEMRSGFDVLVSEGRCVVRDMDEKNNGKGRYDTSLQ